MEQDYIHDVFLSYRRIPPVGDWVRNHFHPLLSKWLPLSMPYEPKIFIDEEIQKGSKWPFKLRNALKNSRCLVTVWSPDYFRSSWCLAEWHSMMKQEKLLNLKTVENPDGLIYPVVFADGEHFPPEAKQTQQKDLRNWNISSPAFVNTIGYVEFEKEMQSVVQEIWEMVKTAPDWREDWPIVTPDVDPTADNTVPINLPRLQ